MAPGVGDDVKQAHARLGVTISRLTDAEVRRPSLLPGWTVGHVLAHLARNADSHVRMLEAAAHREVADQYAGGNAQRAADIEAGSGRPAVELVADVLATTAHLEAVWDATPEEAWRGGHGRVVSGMWPLADLPFRRWREVEVHHADLGLRYGTPDWPDGYVEVELARSVAGLAARLPTGAAVTVRAVETGDTWVVPEGAAAPQPVTGERRMLLAWLLGRGGPAGLPPLGPWTG